jgi:hypothetical protein
MALAHVWVNGRLVQNTPALTTFWSYKLFDDQNNLRAQGRGRVADFWQEERSGPWLDIPRIPSAAEFYAVIRGIIAAQEAGYAGVVIHLAKGWIADMIEHPVRLSDETCHLMRDHILELGMEIRLEFVVEQPSCVKDILLD